jgi:hypothetical protein
MTTINPLRQSAIELDIQKRGLESSIIVRLKHTFKNMANDASNLYRATGSLQTQQLANNYAPEFLKEIRDAMRKSIRKFGFNLRKTVEKKHGLFFDADNKALYIEMQWKQSIVIIDEELDPKLEEINNQFLLASTVFVANESENQNQFVTETNTNMLDLAIIAGIAEFSKSVARIQDQINTLNNSLLTAPTSRRAKINRQIATATRQIRTLIANKQAIVAENIRINILGKAPSRSELIASQNVGLAESWARQTEAELINGAHLIIAAEEEVGVEKEWVSILDGSTRTGTFNHVTPDGQTRPVDEPFNVSGEPLMQPRAVNGSAGNILRCRCIAIYKAIARQISDF